MLHEYDKKNSITISNGLYTFEDIYKKSYVPQEFMEDIKRASILFLPYENYRNQGINLFPEDTRELFDCFIKELKKENIGVEICASDDEFKIIELHSEIINITVMICSSVVLPIVTKVIASFIYDKLKKNNKTDVNANIELHVEKKGKSKTIHYKGSATGFKDAMDSIKDDFFKD